MTKKRKKSIDDNTRIVMINRNEYVGKDQVIAYLLEKIKSYSGYGFISVGPSGSVFKKNPEKKNIVRITIHQTVPCMQPDGTYKSAKDIVIDAISVNDDNFPGMVIDRHGNGILGNPFAPIAEDKLPILGDEDAGTKGDELTELLKLADQMTKLSPTEPPKPTYSDEGTIEQM